MTQAKYIPQERAGHLTQARVLEILDGELSSQIDSELNRQPDDTIQPADGNYTGVYVPDPERYVEQPSPTVQKAMEIERVALFSGQTAPADHGEENAVGDKGHLRTATVPWAVSFVFAPAPSQPAHPVLDRDLTIEEHTNARAQCYRDMIAHTLDQYGLIGTGANARAHAVRGITVDDTYGSAVRMRYGDSSSRMRGTGFVEFTIDQWRLWPPHTQT